MNKLNTYLQLGVIIVLAMGLIGALSQAANHAAQTEARHTIKLAKPS